MPVAVSGISLPSPDRSKTRTSKDVIGRSALSMSLHGSVFMALEKDKIVAVATAFDALAVQTGAIEPPDWWPGRMAA
jgi:hypothetical protein